MSMSDIQRILAGRILARRRLIPFIQHMNEAYQAGWVHHDIAYRLERFFKQVKEGKSPRLMLNMPPRAGKSMMASTYFPAWVYGQDPEIDIILTSYNLDLPLAFSRKIRAMLRDDPEYRVLFPGTTLSTDSQSAETWMTGEGGTLVAAGIGGGLTGRGAHILIIDDNVKNSEEADNQQLHEKQLDWFQSTAYTRLAPGGGVLIIATRWNYHDLSGRLQQLRLVDPEADNYELVDYPAIATAYEYRHRDTYDMMRTDEPIDPNDPENAVWELLRKPKEALHPQRFGLALLNRIKANLSARIWSALYQQRPVPDEGLFFQKGYIQPLAEMPALPALTVYTAFDFAIGQKAQNDYTVGSTGLQDPEGRLFVDNVVRQKRDTYGIVGMILDEVERVQRAYPSFMHYVGFEDGAIFKAVEPVLKREMRKRRIFFTYELLTPLTDKNVRARPLQSLMEQGMVYFWTRIPCYDEILTELLQFPAGKHDDIVDSLSWMARLSLAHEPPKPVVHQQYARERSWKERLLTLGNGNRTYLSA